MERATVKEAKHIFRDNFIGIEKIIPFFKKIGITENSLKHFEIPNIPYSVKELESYSKDYILILGIGQIQEFSISIRFLRDKLGFNPELSEPCFYNQDWYLKEDFVDNTLQNKWYLIQKKVFEDSRAVQPAQLLEKGIRFPSAILCTYTFFAYYFSNQLILWEYDFVWCSDTDHNNDRIYVGKYRDIDGVNKNGFSVHRHLALRNCYSAINIL